MAVALRVIKLGGSLLDWDRLEPAFNRWLADQPAAQNVLVVGGGRMADQVRYYDQLHHLDPIAVHFAAAITMSATARLVASVLGGLHIVTEADELSAGNRSHCCVVFDAYAFLLKEEASANGQRLPHGWHVTSDSIAARLAVVTRADELVLLKSKLPERGATWPEVARRGLVDGYFPEAVVPVLLVRYVNLRDAQAAEWQTPDR